MGAGGGQGSASVGTASAPTLQSCSQTMENQPSFPNQPPPRTPAHPLRAVPACSETSLVLSLPEHCADGNRWKTATDTAPERFGEHGFIASPASSWPTSEVMGSREKSEVTQVTSHLHPWHLRPGHCAWYRVSGGHTLLVPSAQCRTHGGRTGSAGCPVLLEPWCPRIRTGLEFKSSEKPGSLGCGCLWV